MKKNILLITSLLFGASSSAQQGISLPRFSPPMDIPLNLAGNFMELRSDHFHSGLDLKTEGREGIPVKAAGDGWISRIKISPWGYGKAVYVDHPNGFTTVYGHLSSLEGSVGKAALDAQYKARSFDVDVTFDRGEVPVSQGQVIAKSGNTGGSSAPHLHFEVRRTSDQHALDPESYGMDVDDTVFPTITGLRIDPLDSLARNSPYPEKAKGFAVTASNDSTYAVKAGLLPAAFGTVGLSVNVIDRYNGNWNTCGIRSLAVSVDGTPVWSATLDEIDFGLQRYADAYMDYRLFKNGDLHYNRCYKLPNNKLALYGKEPAQGRIAVTPGKDHAVQVVATDANGNKSTLTFVLRGATAEEAAKWRAPVQSGELFRYDKENTLTRDGLRFTLPPNALYTNERLGYIKSPAPKTTWAPVHRLHDPLTPLHLAGELSIEVPKPPPAALASKLLIVKLDEKGRPTAIGGTYADGWVTTKVKAFGKYTVMLDTVAPVLTPLNIKPSMKGQASFSLRVGDNLSGLDQWSAKLDGEWILLEYEPKSRILKHTFDAHSSAAGEHTLVVEVRDDRGNRTTLTRTFTR
ncbi:MAG TPA: M23 family metallopeptidase [Flavobacteriales bacterium]|nr:M23 family metallopeptidase [Flavobacteriales bacterium]